VFTWESPQTECGFQAIVDLLHRRRRKGTDHLVDPRLLDCDQVIARHERIVQQTGMLALDSGRLDQQVGRLARSCEVRRVWAKIVAAIRALSASFCTTRPGRLLPPDPEANG
jgi:hypothetical protein